MDIVTNTCNKTNFEVKKKEKERGFTKNFVLIFCARELNRLIFD